jgi:hypothetical protein
MPAIWLSKFHPPKPRVETPWAEVKGERPPMVIQMPKATPTPRPKVARKIPIMRPVPQPKPEIKVARATPPRSVVEPPPKAERPPSRTAESPIDPRQVQAPKGGGAPADTAVAKASLAKSLSFLNASAPPSNRAGGQPLPAGTKYDAYAKGVATTQQGGSPRFTTPGGTGAGDGPINTRGVNAVKMGKVFQGGGTGTGVRGNVDASRVHGQGTLAGNLARGGMTLSGDGQISQSELEKVLAKYIDKLRYCYEKALLYDPGLAGQITLGWVISPGGGASNVKVLSSQMSNQGLHSCLAGVISGIRVPSPSGGSVMVKYPFVFTSSAI